MAPNKPRFGAPWSYKRTQSQLQAEERAKEAKAEAEKRQAEIEEGLAAIDAFDDEMTQARQEADLREPVPSDPDPEASLLAELIAESEQQQQLDAEGNELKQQLDLDMQEVAKQLTQIACQPALDPARDRKACASLAWLANNPTLVTEFFNNTGRRKLDGIVIPLVSEQPKPPGVTIGLRGSLLWADEPRPARLTASALRHNRLAFALILERLFASRQSHAHVAAALDMLPKNVIRIFESVRLQFWEHLYLTLRNPLFIWHAFSVVHEAGISIPKWITRELGNRAKDIAGLVAERPSKDDDVALLVGEALGFGKKPTDSSAELVPGRTYLAQARELQRIFAIYDYVLPRMEHGKIHQTLRNETADAFPVRVEAVRNVFVRVRTLIESSSSFGEND